jgi:hypothetical protein
MSAAGLHKLMGGRFHHAHPECVTCAHFRGNAPGWEGTCVEKQRILCCPRSRPCPAWAAPRPSEAPAPGPKEDT